MATTKLIEHDNQLYAERAIIEHPNHGRIFCVMMRHCEGDVPSWRKGLAFRIKTTDTLDTIKNLENVEYSNGTTAYDVMLNGYDAQRPIVDNLYWANMVIAAIRDAQTC